MSLTNITQGDSKAVGTEEQANLAFNVQVIAVPREAEEASLPSNSWNSHKFGTKYETSAGNTDSKEKHDTERNEFPIKIQERSHDLKRNRSLFSVPTLAPVYTAPRVSRSENRDAYSIAIKINEPFTEEERAGASGVSIDKTTPNAFLRDLQQLHPNDSSFSNKANASVHIECENERFGTDSTGSIRQVPKQDNLEDDGSFVTIEACQKEKMTSTDVATIFSVDARTQNILVANNDYRNQPPPPYYESSGPQYPQQVAYQGRLGQTPVYQQQHVGYAQVPTEASRAPPYRRSEPDPENMFQTKEIRHKFIMRVYMILAMQLLFTFGFIALCIHEKHVRDFVIKRWELSIVAMVGLLMVTFPLVCYMSTRRTFPLNFILLALLTMFMAYMLAYVSCSYKTDIVMLAMGVTAGVCTLLSILACQSWFDITGCGMILCISMTVLMVYGIIAMLVYIFTGSDILYIVYSCLLTLLMCVYLMYDTQQILGGRRVELSPEEYILGALTLYIDIVIIFQHIMFLMGRFCR